MAETRERLLDAAVRTLAAEGITGASARVIAGEAGASQALIFYHYGTVEGLLVEAARRVALQRAAVHRERLAEVGDFAELAAVARQLHAEELASGNVTVLAQLLAAAVARPALAEVVRDNLAVLTGEVQTTVRRLLAGSALEGLLPEQELAELVSATFIGLGLVEGTGANGDTDRQFDALDRVARLVDTVVDLGMIPTAVLRRRLTAVM